MPLKECLGFDDDQSFTPIEELGEQDHNGACGSRGASSFHLAFLKQSELLAKEQVLGNDSDVGANEQPDEREQLHILQELVGSPKDNMNARI